MVRDTNSLHPRVVMLPWSSGNAYQAKLKQAVESAGGSVVAVKLSENWKERIESVQPDILHLHWLHGLTIGGTIPRTLVKGGMFLRKLSTIRRQVKGVVWTCHNLGNHLGWCLGLEKRIVKRACSSFDRIIVHHEAAIDEVIAYFDLDHMRDRFDVIPHGHFMDSYPGSATKKSARQTLGIPEGEVVFLMFGQLRANKGIETLLSAFALLRHETDKPLRLLLAGKAEPEVEELITRVSREERGIDFREGFVAEESVQPLHAAADVAVLPFSSGLTSGSLILAMGFGLPIIGASVGDARHLISHQGGQLVISDNVDELKTSMRQMINSEVKWKAMGEHNRSVVSEFRWDEIGAKTLHCYQRALEQ